MNEAGHPNPRRVDWIQLAGAFQTLVHLPAFQGDAGREQLFNLVADAFDKIRTKYGESST